MEFLIVLFMLFMVFAMLAIGDQLCKIREALNDMKNPWEESEDTE